MLIELSLFYKKYFLVYILSIELSANVSFSKKNCWTSPMVLKNFSLTKEHMACYTSYKKELSKSIFLLCNLIYY